MSKKRAFLSLALNSILLVVLMRVVIGIFVQLNEENYLAYFIDKIRYAQILCPTILLLVTFIYILSLIHSLFSGEKTPKIIDALRLILAASQLAIMLIELCIYVPYNGYNIRGVNYYLFIIVPALTLISFLPTKKEYSAWGLLYSNLGTVLYLGSLITLTILNIITLPKGYDFLNVMTQDYYKSIINIVVLLAATTMASGILMLLARPRGNEI